ncbi:kininogen-2-like isoform X2 [Rhinolophus ferrumequinum]|uniref:Thiol proteinase inhibitor n=1 Tax=Rhinolophus ferrumequinum TaxID=59479 RepID=A0A671EYM6_RHIFE|nr:kininogen-2-like isoform X2 [Rhinolophus ferrumequinum]
MKLIALLFLCSRLLPTLPQKYNSQEIDCNDEDIFKVVDTALKTYNERNQSGNQFVLYRVTEVIKTENPDIFYAVKYEIKEGDCPVKSGKTWQDCDYKDAEEAATGECTATVKKSEKTKFSVATQTCQITPADGPVVTPGYECLGCEQPISTASPNVERVLRYAIEHFNNNTDSSHLFSLKEVKRAQSQVVSGWKYEVTYTIAQTNCSKEKFLFLTPDCMSLLNGDTGECTDNAYIDLQDRIASFSQQCDLYPGDDFVLPPPMVCIGCPREIPVDSPDLEEPLKHSITKLNAENNGNFYFKIDTVHRATSQIVAGRRFSIAFTAKETTCSKESNKELTASCETNKLGEVLQCIADVVVVPWMNTVDTTVNCGSRGKILRLARPPGFSPFRLVARKTTKEGTTKHLKLCEYKGRRLEAGAEPAPENESPNQRAVSPRLIQ